MKFDLQGLGLREPEDWTPVQETSFGAVAEQAMGAQHWPVNAEVLLDSLLCANDCLSGHSLGLSLLGPSDSMGAVDHFPCIADELEEQAKQLEEDWGRSAQASALVAAAKAQHHSWPKSRVHLAQRRGSLDEPQQQQQEEQQCEEGVSKLRRQASSCQEPVTPQRHSNDSSWNESPLPGTSGGLEVGEVQSPDPPGLLSLPDALYSVARPPLALAIRNAQSVRLGRQPVFGAWRGCGRSAWCSQEPRHSGCCNALATVPGLLAYPPGELFQSGVNIEELCRVPEELEGPLAPDTESEGEGARTAADCLSSGKRRADADPDDGTSRSESGTGGTASSGTGSGHGSPVEQRKLGSAAKRMRAAEVSSPAACLAAVFPAAVMMASPTRSLPVPDFGRSSVMGPPSLAAAAAAAAAEANLNPLLCSGMVPVPQAPPAPADAAADTPKLGLSVPPMPANLGAYLRNLGRPAGAPRLRPLPPAPPPAPPTATPTAIAASTPSKPVTRQKNHTPAAAPAPAAPRTLGRRTVLQWHTDSVTDPRTGATVTAVQPGTFCTQCHALSTPVWRAGPFGHKTLCNACGVRWMKYAKGPKK